MLRDTESWDPNIPLTPEVRKDNRVRWNRSMFQMLAEEYSKAALREHQILGQMKTVMWDMGELDAPTDALKPHIIKGHCRWWTNGKPWLA